VRLDDIPTLVVRTLADANAPTNPVPLAKQEVERLFRWAILGKV
jgi:alcohol dehydrogenase class IV